MAPRKETAAKPAAKTEKTKVSAKQTVALDMEALLSLDLEGILKNLSDLGPKAVPAIKEVYESFVGDYRPLLKMAPEIVGMAGKDVASLVAAFLITFNEIVTAEEMQAALAAARKTRAVSRRNALDAYQAEGFTREEALTLVLQDVAATKQTLLTAARNFKVPSSSS